MTDRPKLERPRGTHDVVPAEMPSWQRVTGEIERLCALYGYRKILTPVFEDTALFARTSGAGSDVVQKEMYTFTDRSDRSLTLRPEGTAPICRAYVENGMHRDPQPVKLFTIALDVPIRGARSGPLPRALAGVGRGARVGRSVHRRRADPPLRHAARAPRCDALPPRAELDRVPQLSARLPRHASRLACGQRRPARRRDPGEGRRQPAPGLRQLPRQADARTRGAGRCAEDRRVAVRCMCRALRRRPRRPRLDGRVVHARPDPRSRPRLLHADDVRVHRPAREPELDHHRRRALRLPHRGDRRAADAGNRLRRRDRAAPHRDGGGGCHPRLRRPASTCSSHSTKVRRARRSRAGWPSCDGRASPPRPTMRGAR